MILFSRYINIFIVLVQNKLVVLYEFLQLFAQSAQKCSFFINIITIRQDGQNEIDEIFKCECDAHAF